MRRACIAVLAAATVAGCGGDGSDRFSLRTPGTEDPVVRDGDAAEEVRRGAPTPGEIRVIRGWADALRRGDVERAAAFFALPVRIFTGTPPAQTLIDLEAVRAFNAGLPCGARLRDTRRGPGSRVVATFVLTERPGPGRCGEGTGRLAATAFLIEGRRIVQWLRGPDPPQPESKPS